MNTDIKLSQNLCQLGCKENTDLLCEMNRYLTTNLIRQQDDSYLRALNYLIRGKDCT